MRRQPFKVLFATFIILLGVVVPARAGNPNCNEVDGDYIVTLPVGKNVDDEIKTAPGRAISANFKYSKALNGFAATLTGEQVCAFKKRPGTRVEKDGLVEATGKPGSGSTSSVDWYSWGLDRIDQNKLPLDLSFNTSSTGVGVTAFIIDTGIYAGHSQLNGRVLPGFPGINDGRGTDDCNGHGTHVAGTVGGLNSGVASAVKLVPVRVLDCRGSGSWSGVIAGINWIITYVQDKTFNGKAVANMSLGGGINASVDQAVRNMILLANVTTVVAAGNSSTSACLSSPADVGEAIVVGATNSDDSQASYSNSGKCVDIYAPGTNIKSAWIGSPTASKTISGTSMATPHVTGIVARYLQSKGASTPSIVESDVIAAGKLSPATPNLLVACLTGQNECKTIQP